MIANLMRSLTLTLILSFVFPLAIVGSLFLGLSVLGYLPWLAILGQLGQSQLISVLVIFGNGAILPGLVVIASTCSLVAGFFDLFNFWFYQTAREY